MKIKIRYLINKISKGTIGFFVLIIGVLIFLFGIKYQETCMITFFIGIIMFIAGLFLLFMNPNKKI